MDFIKIITKNGFHVQVGQAHKKIIAPGEHAKVEKGYGIEGFIEELGHVELVS